MGRKPAGLRGAVLVEDRRTERFVRHVLKACGFTGRFYFRVAPAGRGAGEAWVRLEYPGEVKLLRAKPHQRLCLLAFCDGDSVGVDARKAQLDQALVQAQLVRREATERIATPVPTWAIENWLLDLLGHPDVNETRQAASGG